MDQIDRVLEDLARTRECSCPDIECGVWEKVGRQAEGRMARRNALLAMAILGLGFGGGLNFTDHVANAAATDVHGAASLAPSELLQIAK